MALSTGEGSLMTKVSITDFPMKQEFSYTEYSEMVHPETSLDIIETFFDNKVFTPVHLEIEEHEDIKVRFERFDELLFQNHKLDQTYLSAYFKSVVQNDTVNEYDVINIVDINSPAVLPYSTGFMSNALIRHSTGDEDISLNLSYGGFPQSKLLDDVLSTTMAIMTVISFSLSVGSITSAIAANIVTERNETIKHQQMISGAGLFPYWFSIYFVDILKFITPALSFILITNVMDFSVEHSWLLLILLIFSVLPFTYCLTFIFQKDSSARTAVSYLQFLSGGFLSLIIFAFQMLQAGGNYIWIIKWISRIQPGFAF